MSSELTGTISMFGEQALSTRQSYPRAVFGTSGRTEKTADKPFEFKRLGTACSGFTSNPQSGFGTQNSSNNESFPSYRFGLRYASDVDMVKENRPGPGQYPSSTTIGRQVLSARQSAPEFRQGTGTRFAHYKNVFKDDFQTPAAQPWMPSSGWLGDAPGYTFHGKSSRSDISKGLPAQIPSHTSAPGPGTYEATSALGPQAQSSQVTMPRLKLGRSSRDSAAKVFLGRSHEKAMMGKYSPGPSNYAPANLTVTSKVKATSSWKFGSGDRFSEVKSGNGKNLKVWSPGPGSYTV